MKRALLFSAAMSGILIGVFSLAYLTTAAANKFPFTGRAIVKGNHATTKSLDLNFSHLNALARELGLGKTIEVHVGQAKMYKPDASGVLHRITQGNIAIGEEISVHGNVRTDDRFVARKVVVRNRTFSIVGTLKTYDFANKQLKVDVASSTYRPTAFKNGTVTMRFTPMLTIYDGTTLVEPQDLTARNQKIRVEGTVVNTDEFEVKTLWENIP